MDDFPGRHKQNRRLASAVDLVKDLDAIALDVTVLIRVAGARLLPAAICHTDIHWSLPGLEQFGDEGCGVCGAVAFDWFVVDLAPDLLGDHFGDGVRCC